jgi:hypothetical protein
MKIRDRVIIVVLSLLGVVALALSVVGFVVMALANSPTNRQGTPYADIGVAAGAVVGIVGVLAALAFFIAAAVRFRAVTKGRLSHPRVPEGRQPPW